MATVGKLREPGATQLSLQRLYTSRPEARVTVGGPNSAELRQPASAAFARIFTVVWWCHYSGSSTTAMQVLETEHSFAQVQFGTADSWRHEDTHHGMNPFAAD